MRPSQARRAASVVVAGIALGLTGCGSNPLAEPTTAPPHQPTGTAAATTPVAATMPVATAPVSTTIETAATATTTASRAGRRGIDDDCDLALATRIGASHPEAGQVIIVRTTDWAAAAGNLDVVHRETNGTWSCERGNQPAVVGRAGTRPLLQRRSGDGTTPAGFFPLDTTMAWDGQPFQFFGNGPNPGVKGTYRQVKPEDCWGATPGDPAYGHLVNRPSCPGPDDEDLERVGDIYVHAALIGANPEPNVSGDAPGEIPYAAAIFLHRNNYGGSRTSGPVKPTSGCVSLAIDDLVATLQLIDPAEHPYFAIGPADSWT